MKLKENFTEPNGFSCGMNFNVWITITTCSDFSLGIYTGICIDAKTGTNTDHVYVHWMNTFCFKVLYFHAETK